MCSLTHCLCSLLRLWPAVSHRDYVEVFQLSVVCQIKTEYLLPVLTSAICSHQPLTFGRSYRAMAPVLPSQPSLPVTAPAARSQLLTSARSSSKARGHASVHAATAATVQHHLLTADTDTFTLYLPPIFASGAKGNSQSLLS